MQEFELHEDGSTIKVYSNKIIDILDKNWFHVGIGGIEFGLGRVVNKNEGTIVYYLPLLSNESFELKIQKIKRGILSTKEIDLLKDLYKTLQKNEYHNIEIHKSQDTLKK